MNGIIKEKGIVVLWQNSPEFDEFRYKVTNINYRVFFSDYNNALYNYKKQCNRNITSLEKLHEIIRLSKLIHYINEDRADDKLSGVLTPEIRLEYFEEKKDLKKQLSKVANVSFDDLDSLPF